MSDGMYLLGPDVMDPDVYEPCPTCNTEGCDDCDRLGLVLHECSS